MNFKELESVLAVYQYHSFSEASIQTSFSLSAISKHVSRAEDELGLKLFERKTKASNMDLTEAGRQLFPLISQIVGDYHSLLKQAERCKGSQNKVLSIGYIPLIGTVGEAAVITDYYAKFPDMKIIPVIMCARDLLRLLDADKIDGAFIMLIGNFDVYRNDWEILSNNRLRFIPTMRHQRLYMAISTQHPLAARSSVSLPEFAGDKFIFSDSQDTRVQRNGGGRMSYIERLIGKPFDDGQVLYLDFLQKDVVLSLVAQNHAVMPCSCYNGERYDGVRYVPVDGWSQAVTGVFAYRTGSVSASMRDFKECVEEYSRKHVLRAPQSLEENLGTLGASDEQRAVD